MSWSSGDRKSMTKKFGMQLINSCDPLRFPTMTLAQLTCEQLDLLLYIVTGISPATRPHDFGANCKRDAQKMCRQQHLQQIKRQPGRMDQLTDDLDNLPVVAMRLGYQPEWLSPALRQAYFQSRSAMQAPGFGSGNGGNPEAPLALVNTVAVPGTPLREVPQSLIPVASPDLFIHDDISESPEGGLSNPKFHSLTSSESAKAYASSSS